jgi:outer membrane protein TolC
LQAPEWSALKKAIGSPTYKRLEIERNELLIESLQASKRLRLSVNFPSLYFNGSWGRNGTKKSALFDEDYTSWNMGLRLSIPIFSGLSSLYDRRAYSSLIAQSRIFEKKLIDQASLEQVRAEQEITNAITQVTSSEKALVQAKESVTVAERSYRLGTATYLQVSDTQQKLANADLSFSQAQFDLISKMCAYFNAFNFPLQPLVEALDASSKKPIEPPSTGEEAKRKKRSS